MPRIETKEIIKLSLIYSTVIILLTVLASAIIITSGELVSSIVSYKYQIIIVASVVLILSLYFQRQQTRISLKNADLYNKLSLQQEQMEQDIQVARVVQQGVINTDLSKIKNVKVAARCLPAANVGGDFYGAGNIGEDVYFFVGDVSGHGISSALVMTLSYSLINELTNEKMSPAVLATELNRQLKKYLGDSIHYLTLFYGYYNKKSRTLTYLNAGHPSAIAFEKNDKIKMLSQTGPIVGMFEKADFKHSKMKLTDRLKLVVYTDGFVECSLEDGRCFDETNFKNYLVKEQTKKPAELIDSVYHMAEGLIVKDDLTIMCLDIK